jgi:hemerythrin
MSIVTKGISMFILSILIMALLVMIILGFMLGFSHPLPWILIGILFIIPFIHNNIISKRFVKWNESYSVGIESIDNDHKKLLGMINQLQTAVHYTTDESMIEVILNDLVDYTKYHFSREEGLMQECNYPDFSEHKKQHEAMIKQVLHYIDEYRKHNKHTIDEVTQYLKSWLINHINGCDQDYSPYLKGKVK